MKPVTLQLKSVLKASSLTVAIVLFPFVGLALDVKDVPNPRQINGTWVTDMAGILDQPTKAQINSLITQLERENGAEVPQPSTISEEPTQDANDIWGLLGWGGLLTASAILWSMSQVKGRSSYRGGHGGRSSYSGGGSSYSGGDSGGSSYSGGDSGGSSCSGGDSGGSSCSGGDSGGGGSGGSC